MRKYAVCWYYIYEPNCDPINDIQTKIVEAKSGAEAIREAVESSFNFSEIARPQPFESIRSAKKFYLEEGICVNAVAQ
jgi:hypothetical protein